MRTSDGAETRLLAVTLQPGEVQSLNLSNVLKQQAPQLIGSYGSVALHYSSPSVRNLYAVSMVYEDGHPVAFHLDAGNTPPNWQVGSREGIWWLPNATATAYMILTNQSDSPLSTRRISTITPLALSVVG